MPVALSLVPPIAPPELLETLANRCVATFLDADGNRCSRETHRYQAVLLGHLQERVGVDRLAGLSCDELALIAELLGRTRAMVIASVLDEPTGEQIARSVAALTHLYLRSPFVAAS